MRRFAEDPHRTALHALYGLTHPVCGTSELLLCDHDHLATPFAKELPHVADLIPQETASRRAGHRRRLCNRPSHFRLSAMLFVQREAFSSERHSVVVEDTSRENSLQQIVGGVLDEVSYQPQARRADTYSKRRDLSDLSEARYGSLP